jgi:surface polysaccharide O-acyltransferase-like enzyme
VTHGRVKFSFEGPTTILTAIALFLFVIKHPVQLPPKCGKIVEHLSGMTFGIYMVHTFVITEIFTRLHRFVPNVYLLLPLTIVATFGLSYLIILVIKQIPVLKKWVV